jgi:uncharacterized protein YjbI with pentapeptide repeats
MMAGLAIGAAVTLVVFFAGLALWLVSAALLIVFAGLAIWRVPHWQARGWRHAKIGEEKQAELVVQARTSMIQAFGGLALIATLAITGYQVSETRRSSSENLSLAARGQVSERFSRAVEDLGATNAKGDAAIDIRTGALFALRGIGLDSTLHTEPAFRVAAHYVRNHYTAPKDLPDSCKARKRAAPDIATALTYVLPRLATKLVDEKLPEDPKERESGKMGGLNDTEMRGLVLDKLVLINFDLKNIDLRAARLTKLDAHGSILNSAFFTRACLPGANFRGARLQGANFEGANLKNANFQGADVHDADFSGASLQYANFRGANVEGADFSGANLDRANFFGASLIRAEFCGAIFGFTDFRSARMNQAKFDVLEGVPKGIGLAPAQREVIDVCL